MQRLIVKRFDQTLHTYKVHMASKYMKREFTISLMAPRPKSNMWRVPALFTTPNNRQTPAECPRIPCTSDTIYPETASDPTGEGLGSLAPSQLLSRRQPLSLLSMVLLTTCYTLEAPTVPSKGLINLLG